MNKKELSPVEVDRLNEKSMKRFARLARKQTLLLELTKTIFAFKQKPEGKGMSKIDIVNVLLKMAENKTQV